MDEPVVATILLSWNFVRICFSPFLKFALVRSIPLILGSGVAAALGASVYAGSTDADRLFLVTVIGLWGLPMLALFHLWKLAHFKALFAAFDASTGVNRQ